LFAYFPSLQVLKTAAHETETKLRVQLADLNAQVVAAQQLALHAKEEYERKVHLFVVVVVHLKFILISVASFACSKRISLPNAAHMPNRALVSTTFIRRCRFFSAAERQTTPFC
jgi:hypothetical protein